MKLSRLRISNFRNYDEEDIEFSKSINLFIGNNAQGKTNILEAIYVLCTLKSFRAHKDDQLIGNNKNESRIEADLETRGVNKNISIQYFREGKKIVTVNNKKLAKSSDFIGTINISILSPEDIMMVKGDSSLRRKFMDITLCQSDKYYLNDLIRYQKILKNRNYLLKLIKLGKDKEASLDPWDEQICELAPLIANKRAQMINQIDKIAHQAHHCLSDSQESLHVKYLDALQAENHSGLDHYRDEFRKRQKSLRREEIIRGITLLGPHRDDLGIEVNRLSVRHFGSQGQQRSAVISLRMAEIEFIYSEVTEYPILLVDDIFSELDDQRKNHLMQLLDRNMQMFMTGTRITEFTRLASRAKIYPVEKGKVLKNV